MDNQLLQQAKISAFNQYVGIPCVRYPMGGLSLFTYLGISPGAGRRPCIEGYFNSGLQDRVSYGAVDWDELTLMLKPLLDISDLDLYACANLSWTSTYDTGVIEKTPDNISLITGGLIFCIDTSRPHKGIHFSIHDANDRNKIYPIDHMAEILRYLYSRAYCLDDKLYELNIAVRP